MQPFSVLLRAELTAFDSSLHVRQQHGYVHGGGGSYAADYALTFATGSATTIANFGARLQLFSVEHPDPAAISSLYEDLGIAVPSVRYGSGLRLRALIHTAQGIRELS